MQKNFFKLLERKCDSVFSEMTDMFQKMKSDIYESALKQFDGASVSSAIAENVRSNVVSAISENVEAPLKPVTKS